MGRRFRPGILGPRGGFVGTGPLLPHWPGKCRLWRFSERHVAGPVLRPRLLKFGKRPGHGACWRGVWALAAMDPVESEFFQLRRPATVDGASGASSEREPRSRMPSQLDVSDESKSSSESQGTQERPAVFEGKPSGVRLFLHRNRRAAATSLAGTAAGRDGSRLQPSVVRDLGRPHQRPVEHRRMVERFASEKHGAAFIQVSSQVARALEAKDSRKRKGSPTSSALAPLSAEDMTHFLDEITLRCAYLGPIGASLVRIALERALKHPKIAAPQSEDWSVEDTNESRLSELTQHLDHRKGLADPLECITPAASKLAFDSAGRKHFPTVDGVAARSDAGHVLRRNVSRLWRLRAILNTVIDLQMDLEAVLAAALQDSCIPAAEIAHEFGRPVADILAQERAIRQIIHATSMDSNPAGLRQLMIGIARDWRAIALFFAEVLFELRSYGEELGLMDVPSEATLESTTAVPESSCASTAEPSDREWVGETDPLRDYTQRMHALKTVTSTNVPQCIEQSMRTTAAEGLRSPAAHPQGDAHPVTPAPANDEATSVTRAAAHRMAILTLEVLAPLANQLGIYYIQCEMEELAFLLLFPVQGEALRRQVAMRFEACADVLDQARQAIADALSTEPQVHNHVSSWHIRGRVKSLYSTYRKMLRLGSGLDDVLDLMALRVVVRPVDPSTEQEACDMTMAAIERLWPCIDGRRRDFIRSPKDNGYQSLHTTVLVDGFPVEVQVRSERMHRLAEYGRAAHWLYKQNTGVRRDSSPTKTSAGDSNSELSTSDVANWDVASLAAAITRVPCAPSIGEFEFESQAADHCNGKSSPDVLIQKQVPEAPMTAAITNGAPSGPQAETEQRAAASPTAAASSEPDTIVKNEVVLDDTVTASLGTHTEYFRVLYHQIVELEQHVTVFDVDSGQLLRLPRGTKLGQVARARVVNGRSASADTILRTGDQIGGAHSSQIQGE
jgi:ppGpp synthetase/RelA/SpoT-type nucleotidyltranferase